ncbi:hypothetical protein C8J56DRAFT_945151 [Mycena floridula]|nr:hypothetical protein C8J56DRAFT_945151 [Mycena floridula]
MSSLIHCFSEWSIIIAFAMLIKPFMHSAWQGIPPIYEQLFYIPFLTITHSPILVCTLICRRRQHQPYNHSSTHLKRCRLDFPPLRSLHWSSCEASFKGRSR